MTASRDRRHNVVVGTVEVGDGAFFSFSIRDVHGLWDLGYCVLVHCWATCDLATLAMGSCCSCCRRKRAPRSNDDSDCEPLLPAHSYDALPPEKTPFEKIADVVAAARAGKLPSQQQLAGALRSLLASGVLDTGDDLDGAAGEAAKRVVDCAREAARAVLQFGMEKNGAHSLSYGGIKDVSQRAILRGVVLPLQRGARSKST